MGTTKARRRERYAQDPDYRAKQRAYCRAYYRARKQEINERNRAYYHAHKQDIKPILRRGQLKRLYGISPADYDALLAKQDGVCATCGKPSKETLCVDHCHATGTIRGLLCRKCNTGLGCYEDDPATLVTALAYLACGRRESAGAAAQRALAARAVLPPGRAGVTLRVDPRLLDRLDADAATSRRSGTFSIVWTAHRSQSAAADAPHHLTPAVSWGDDTYEREKGDAFLWPAATPPPPSSRPRRPAPPGGAGRECAAPGLRRNRR